MKYPGALIDVNGLCNTGEQLGEEWAQHEAAFRALDDATKSVLSRCKSMYRGSDAAATAQALRDERYEGHLKALAAAREAAALARVRYDMHKVRIELTRSNASTERAKMGLL